MNIQVKKRDKVLVHHSVLDNELTVVITSRLLETTITVQEADSLSTLLRRLPEVKGMIVRRKPVAVIIQRRVANEKYTDTIIVCNKIETAQGLKDAIDHSIDAIRETM